MDYADLKAIYFFTIIYVFLMFFFVDELLEFSLSIITK